MLSTRRFMGILIISLTVVVASSAQKHYFKAEKQFELKAFDLAIDNAKKALDKDPDCIECYRLIAESFRMTNNNVDAAIWYRKMEKFPNLPSDYAFNYGLLLKRMGQYDKAKKYFTEYMSIDREVGQYFAQSCDFAKATLSKEKDFELNLFGISSKNTDFGPAVFKDKIVFSSFRPDIDRSVNTKQASPVHQDKCQFFIAANNYRSGKNAITPLLADNIESYDMGAIHYAAEAPVCAVTKHEFMDGGKQIFTDEMQLSLHLAKVDASGAFSDVIPFPHNEVGYATGFGTLNPNGTILYFSSNRPGGLGGFDLYVSYFKNGKWTYPMNLGPSVNTQGNEITPFFDGTDLYYSSDYLTGIGGFDVFSSHVVNGSWMLPQNMGNGVNSPEDDYYFVKHPQAESYYLTSNRLGGRGSHDIYLVHKIQVKEVSLELAATENIPAAVDLETDLVERTPGPQVRTVSLETSTPPAPVNIADELSTKNTEVAEKVETREAIDFNKLLPPKAIDLNAKASSNMISLAGAKRVAVGEVLKTNSSVYFIQLAALFQNQVKLENYSSLSGFGNLYTVNQSNATKVKLGYFYDEQEAKTILRRVKSSGYSDAFITYEVMNSSRMELLQMSNSSTTQYSDMGYNVSPGSDTKYKVRLASYEDPIWFDVNKVNDIGVIEQWSKGDWTIFILSGFNSLDEAEAARVAALNRGFSDAKVVRDSGGILEDME